MSASQLTAWSKKQPENLNYLRPNGFRFGIHSIPKVSYFCNQISLPDISLGVATVGNSFIDLPLPGEKLKFGDLSIRFLIQEDLANYMELFNWLKGLGFPDDRKQHDRLRKGLPQNFPEVNNKNSAGEFSDATLQILDSNNEAVATVMFYDCFPVALSTLPFDATTGEVEYFQCAATFKFRRFEMERVVKST